MLQAGAILGEGVLLGNRAASKANTAYDKGIWMGAPAKFLYQPAAIVPTANPGDPDPHHLCLKWLPVMLVLSLAESVVVPLYFSFVNLSVMVPLVAQSSAYLLLLFWTSSLFPCAWSLMLTLVYKWGVYGTFREDKPDAAGSWGLFTSQLYSAAAGNLSNSCEPLKGTSAWNALLRAQGADIGAGACCLSSLCPELDMVRVGKGTIIGPDTSFGAHILDKGVYSYAPIVIGEYCTLEEGSNVMGYQTLQARVHLLPFSRGMKGMLLREGRVYGGNPIDAISEGAAANPLVLSITSKVNLSSSAQGQRPPHKSPSLLSNATRAGRVGSRLQSLLDVGGWFDGPRTEGEQTSLLGQHGDIETATRGTFDIEAATSGSSAAHDELRRWWPHWWPQQIMHVRV